MTQTVVPGQDESAELPKGGLKPDPRQPGLHVARADRLFRFKRYIVVLLVVGFGAASAWHGFVAWPRETTEFQRIEQELQQALPGSDQGVALREELKQYSYHSETDILFNRVMAVVLPPLGLLLLARWLYMSRGQLKLDESDTLYAPGHAPIPLSTVASLDDALWHRKGISYVMYTAAESGGRVRLDHDWYEPKSIHAIHDRLVYLLSQRAGGAA